VLGCFWHSDFLCPGQFKGKICNAAQSAPRFISFDFTKLKGTIIGFAVLFVSLLSQQGRVKGGRGRHQEYRFHGMKCFPVVNGSYGKLVRFPALFGWSDRLFSIWQLVPRCRLLRNAQRSLRLVKQLDKF